MKKLITTLLLLSVLLAAHTAFAQEWYEAEESSSYDFAVVNNIPRRTDVANVHAGAVAVSQKVLAESVVSGTITSDIATSILSNEQMVGVNMLRALDTASMSPLQSAVAAEGYWSTTGGGCAGPEVTVWVEGARPEEVIAGVAWCMQ